MPTDKVPEHALERGTVFLNFIHGIPSNAKNITWYRSVSGSISIKTIMSLDIETKQITEGEVFTGREMLYSNGSLKIKNITLDFLKTYLAHVYDKNGKRLDGYMQFQVYCK